MDALQYMGLGLITSPLNLDSSGAVPTTQSSGGTFWSKLTNITNSLAPVVQNVASTVQSIKTGSGSSSTQPAGTANYVPQPVSTGPSLAAKVLIGLALAGAGYGVYRVVKAKGKK